VLAVRSPGPPDELWPWARLDDFWVLRIEPAGPGGAVLDDRVYEPSQAWRAEWPAAFRLQVLLLGVVAGCLIGGVAMWRSRAALFVVVIMSVACVAGIIGWRHSQLTVPQIRGDVLVHHSGAIVQRDAWHYQAAVESVKAAFAWQDLSRPMPAGQWHLDQTGMILQCRSDGEPEAFIYELSRRMRIAFLTRGISHGLPPGEPVWPVTSPIDRIARTMYLSRDYELLGEVDESHGGWPSVILRRRPD
jgi:hypothetical protein